MEQKRTAAEERKAECAKLTPEDRLARLESAPGESKKERAKLLRMIEKRGKTKKKKEKTNVANPNA
jgi:hypothetical protein